MMQDYALGRFHFVDMGEQMHRHIYELNLSWGQMLDFYTDLNNARKERDDKYLEVAFIGEEVIEPDERELPFSEDAETGEMGSALYDSNKDEGVEEGGNEILGELKQEIQADDAASKEESESAQKQQEEEKDEADVAALGEKIGISATQVIE